MADQSNESDEPQIAAPREKHDIAGWSERIRAFSVDGSSIDPHWLAGALYDAEPGETFTQAQVQRRLDSFAKREAS